jgi:nicotinamide-nucleotide amidase
LRAAVLTIGDELTCGYRLDTNSQAISRRLALLPVDVVLHMTVSDDRDAIHRALRVALEEAEVLVITGGLGPTEDDLTRQAVAAYFGLQLRENAEALDHIRERFAHRGRAMPESNRVQALVPAGSTIIFNDRGTAAGFYLATSGKHLFVTPGIPYEMEGMLEGFILPRLQELVGDGRHVQRAALKIYGLPESEINERVQPMLARDRNPLLGLLPHRGTITVELAAAGTMPEEVEALLRADLAALQDEFGRYIISQDGQDLPQVVAGLLVDRGLTIATAELGTGGLVAARLSEPEGVERWLRRSVVFAGEDETPPDLLGEEAAAKMAHEVREASQANIGVGVGAFVMSADNTSGRPYGMIDVAVNVLGHTSSRRLSFNGARARVREWAADAVLALVRLRVLEQDQGDESPHTRRAGNGGF